MKNNRLSRIEFLDKVKNKEFKNGSEFTVFKGDVEVGIVGVQRSIVVYVYIPRDVFDLLTNNDYSFEPIIEETE